MECSKLNRIDPRDNPSPNCQLCSTDGGAVPETLDHSMGSCTANLGLPDRLLRLLQLYQPGARQRQILTLDLELDANLELPMTWTIGSLLFSIWRQRCEGRISLARTRAELEARCRLLREGKVRALANAFTLTDQLLTILFNDPL